jgi:hypothetical protein
MPGRGGYLHTVGVEHLMTILVEFDAELRKDEHPGAWTYLAIDNVPELFGTRASEDPWSDRWRAL